MLLVNTKLDKSPIHGMGVFACDRIPAGSEVWKFFPNFDLERTVDEVNALPPGALEWFRKYAYLDFRINCYILSVDNARFMNHSDDPNIRPDFSRDRHGIGVTTKDIQSGEELTIDYRLIEKDNWLSKQT